MPKESEDLIKACLELLGRSAAENVRIGFTDEDAGDPIVWWVHVHTRFGSDVCAADLSPVLALWKVVEDQIDGGVCTHCHKVTGVVRDSMAGDMPKGEEIGGVCWFAYDPELKTFRRGCEGVAP
jgi:hypothetical protein